MKPEIAPIRLRLRSPERFVLDACFRRPAVGADYSSTGDFGDPSLATAEKGRAFLEAMTEDRIEGASSPRGARRLAVSFGPAGLP